MADAGARSISWGRVIGEFVVIVSGVLVALAVDSCYRDRQDRAAEVDYLQRLLADVQADTASLRFQTTLLAEKVEALDLVSETVQTGAVPDDSFAFLGAVKHGTSFSWGVLPLGTVTYDDLVGTGNLGLITDAGLRRRILDYQRNAVHRINRIENRGTGYGNLVYRLVPAEILAAFPQTDARAPGNLARAPEEAVPDVGRVNALAPAALSAIRNEEFIRVLNAERNYALFAMAMMRETLDEAHSVLIALEGAAR